MNADNKAPATGERDVIRPLDNHQPIIGAGATPQVKPAGDRDIVRPMDNHQPVATPRTDDNHQPSPGDGAAQKD